MENASKALIMAGAIIIAVVIVSLSVWLFRRSSELVKDNNFSDVEIEEFNSKIEPYCGESISGSQVNALINIVRALDNASVSSEGESLYADIVYKDAAGTEKGYIRVSTSPWKVEDNMPRVPTGGSYYKVEADYSSSVRIKSITIQAK